MKMLQSTLVSLTIFLSSCGGIDFDPDIYLPNINTGNIVNEDGFTVSMNSPEMLKFGCMHENKWQELAEILEREGVSDDRVKRILNRIKENKP